MHIFLDESGSFTGFGSEAAALSVQGALVIPSYKLPKLFARYTRLRHGLPKRNGEVKGSQLNEIQVAAIVDLLRRNEAIFSASVIDMADHSEGQVKAHQASMANSLAANLTDGHTPELRASVAELQKRLSGFSLQLYAQARVTIDLLHRLMEEMIFYHSQRNPKELSSFHWVIDAKNKGLVTNWEDWWAKTLVIWLQALSMAKPGRMLPGGNYTHFRRFFLKELPKYLKERAPKVTPGPAVGIDLQLMFRESFRFSSDPEPGLELVDIVTNALRRALVGNLREAGWLPLRSLMIHRSEVYVSPVSLGGKEASVTKPHKKVLNKFRSGGRNMSTPSLEWPE